MIRILLCCGGGFSSSAIAQRMTKEIAEKGLTEEVYMEFYPFSIAKERFHEFDVVLCCPHLKQSVTKLANERELSVPLYILPPKMYGMMILEEIVQDAKDILTQYQKTKVNPVYFPGEENILRVTRNIAYRKLKTL